MGDDLQARLINAERKIRDQRKEIDDLLEMLEFYRACYDNGPHVGEPPALTTQDVIELNRIRIREQGYQP